MPAKSRVRTSQYLSVVRPVEGSLGPVGLTAAYWVTLGIMSWGLVNGGSTNEGLCLLVGETCYRRVASGTTWVALPTINPVWASSDPMLGNAQGRLPMIWRLGGDINLRRDGPHSPLVPDFSIPAGYFVVGFPGDTAMADQFGRAPLASLPVPTLRNGAAAARPLLWAP